MSAPMFVAAIYSRQGRVDEAFAGTREQAARELFARHPKARDVTTGIATWDERAGNWRDLGRDIRTVARWHLNEAR
ncbi:MAG: hypothetical protein JO105_15330 [Hyphomicrobiales bacterium]|nr:hypothetical protein [Hyphomicrobiales bacterium]